MPSALKHGSNSRTLGDQEGTCQGGSSPSLTPKRDCICKASMSIKNWCPCFSWGLGFSQFCLGDHFRQKRAWKSSRRKIHHSEGHERQSLETHTECGKHPYSLHRIKGTKLGRERKPQEPQKGGYGFRRETHMRVWKEVITSPDSKEGIQW